MKLYGVRFWEPDLQAWAEVGVFYAKSREHAAEAASAWIGGLPEGTPLIAERIEVVPEPLLLPAPVMESPIGF